ncbi:hypothetical protein UlMin_040283 [Ulmus minor]
MSGSNESPPIPDADSKTLPPADSSPPAPAENTSPPSPDQTKSPPPTQSSPSNSAPPPNDTSSFSSSPPPLSTSDSPPPSPPSPPPSSPSPPSESKSPPPSGSSPPTPSSSSPPPSVPSHQTPSSSPPPEVSSAPPPPHVTHSPPPIGATPSPPTPSLAPSTGSFAPPHVPGVPNPPPPSPGSQTLSSPAAPGTPPLDPTTPTPPNELVSPTTTPSGFSPPPPLSNRNHVPSLSPPILNSKSVSSSSGTSNSPSQTSVHTGTVVGVAVAGVFIITLIAVFFVVARRRKRRAEVYAAAHYMPAGTISVKSDGYYVGQQHNYSGGSGPTDGYYVSQTPHSGIVNSYGSQRGNPYHGGTPEPGMMGGPNPYFSYEELMEITNGFSHQNVLGEGGFGCVYKGVLSDGRLVAIKQLKAGSGQGEREFKAEVEIISRVHHRHLVSLVGYCISENHRLLVYEFVPNQTLEHHMHGVGMPVLDWTKRLKIALGAAKGLAYLHEDCHPKIIHRDIKSANILLDDVFEAQVADFGLAKPSNDSNTHVSTRVMGTFGYMAPEYASSGKLTDRSDVFSFGVVLLELITGRKPVDPAQPLGDESLVEWARPLLIQALDTGNLSEIVDPRLEKHYVEGEMLRMIEAAAACVRHSAPKRPRMMQVVRVLDCEAEMSDLSNGVKYGQSTIYDSGQYNQDILKFRRMIGTGDSSEYNTHSGEYNTREVSGPQNTWHFRDGSSGESETRAFSRNGEPRYSGPQTNFGGRPL